MATTVNGALGQIPILPAIGGTGVNNGSSTITLAGNLVTSGAFSTTLISTNTTSITLPTTGTLATTAQLVSLPISPTNGGLGANESAATGVVQFSSGTSSVSTALAAGTTATTQSLSDNSTKVSTTAYVQNQIVNSNRPAFIATLGGGAISNATGDGTSYLIIFNNDVFFYGSGYSTITGLFTAPNTGFYQLNASIQVTSLSVGHTGLAGSFLAGSTTYNFSDINPYAVKNLGDNDMFVSGSALVYMTAAQTAQVNIVVAGSTKTVGISTLSSFSGVLIC